MIKKDITKDILYYGLPAIWIKDGYLVYSPYVKEFICLKENQLHDLETFEELSRIGFFSKSIDKIPSSKTKEMKIVVLEITKQCNLKCIYCFANASSKVNSIMSPYVATNIIEGMSKQNKLMTIHFIGGEPTLNFVAIRSVKERADEINLHPNYYITTNGTAPELISNWLIDNGFIFKISWDGLAQAQTRTFVGGQDSGVRVEQTIANLAKKGCNFCIRMTVTRSNLPYILDSIQKCAEIGAKFFHIEPMSPDGRGSNIQHEVPNAEDFVELFSKAVTIAEKKGLWLINSALANLFSPEDCFCCSLRDQIYHFNLDGTISSCYKVTDKDNTLADRFTIGTYRVQDNQLLLHTNSGLFCRLNTSSNGIYSSCNNCFLRFICSGGCHFRNLKSNPLGNDVDSWTCQVRMGILRMAILHLYKRALAGKGSCLEGNFRFYQQINHKGR